MIADNPACDAAQAGDAAALDARGRLVALAAERKVSLAALSAMIGRNAAYLQQFVRKGSPRKLEEGDRRTLARFFGVEEAQLGAPDAGGQADEGGPWIDVPRLEVAASAGPGALGAADRAFGALRFAVPWLRAQGLDPGRLSTIAVRGDSMEPLLHDGDEVLVETGGLAPVPRAVHVVRHGEALLVKRLDPRGGGRIALVSDNPAYPPVELAADEVVFVGRVVWKSGRV